MDISDGDPEEVQDLRAELEIEVDAGAADYCAPVERFEDITVFPEYLQQQLVELDFDKPLPIQAQALPIVLAGHDLIGIARTGSGKTLAFLLPAIVHIEAQEPVSFYHSTPITLVLAPTRELVAQIAQEAAKLCENSTQGAHPRGIWAREVYGGKQREAQAQKAKGCAIMAATPGRLTDFIQTGDVSLERVTYFVLDEADRMLDLGFLGDIQSFSSKIRKDRQMLFFSATWPAEVSELATSLCKNSEEPVTIRVGQKDDGNVASRPDITQAVVVFDEDDWEERDAGKKDMLYDHLRQILEDEENKVLVFVNQKALADELRDVLAEEGFKTDSMHGGKSQTWRDEALENFKNGVIRLLIATDVMGRGLDIPTISHVVIYDMGEIEDYIHRIGRTARGLTDRPGHALTFFEYDPKWPGIAADLMKVLEESEQEVPEDLQRIVDEVSNGTRRKEQAPKKKKNKTQFVEAPVAPAKAKYTDTEWKAFFEEEKRIAAQGGKSWFDKNKW